MFEEHFRLHQTPFGRSIPVDSIYPSKAHQEAMRRLGYVAQQRRIMMLTGDAGSGKSTALRALAGSLNPTAFLILYLADVAFTPRSFFMTLLSGLGHEMPFQISQAKALARHALLQCRQTHQRTPVILIDEAQNLSPTVLEEVRGLCNFDFDAFSPFALVLAGTRDLARRLSLQPFEALAQRIDLHFHLSGMTQEETVHYVRHQLQRAGAQSEIFTPEALHRIYQACQGIPRRLNKLATLIMMAGASNGTALIDADLVDKVVIHELQMPA